MPLPRGFEAFVARMEPEAAAGPGAKAGPLLYNDMWFGKLLEGANVVVVDVASVATTADEVWERVKEVAHLQARVVLVFGTALALRQQLLAALGKTISHGCAGLVVHLPATPAKNDALTIECVDNTLRVMPDVAEGLSRLWVLDVPPLDGDRWAVVRWAHQMFVGDTAALPHADGTPAAPRVVVWSERSEVAGALVAYCSLEANKRRILLLRTAVDVANEHGAMRVPLYINVAPAAKSIGMTLSSDRTGDTGHDSAVASALVGLTLGTDGTVEALRGRARVEPRSGGAVRVVAAHNSAEAAAAAREVETLFNAWHAAP